MPDWFNNRKKPVNDLETAFAYALSTQQSLATRLQAIEFLGWGRDLRSFQVLVEVCQDTNKEIRQATALALQTFAQQRLDPAQDTVTALLKTLRDTDVLGSLVSACLQADPKTGQPALATTLAFLLTPCAQPAKSILKSKIPPAKPVHFLLANSSEVIKPKPLQPQVLDPDDLLNFLRFSSEAKSWVRQAYLDWLNDQPGCAGWLLNQGHTPQGRTVLKIYAGREDKSLLPLIAALHSEHSETRLITAKALGETGSPAIIEPLKLFLLKNSQAIAPPPPIKIPHSYADENFEVEVFLINHRCEGGIAAIALGLQGETAALRPLVQLTAYMIRTIPYDFERDVTLKLALERTVSAAKTPAEAWNVLKSWAKKLANPSKNNPGPVIKALADLGQIKKLWAVPILLQALLEPHQSTPVLSEAAWSLMYYENWQSDEMAAEPHNEQTGFQIKLSESEQASLQRLLDHADQDVRLGAAWASIEAIKYTPGSEAKNAQVVAALQAPHWEVRYWALRKLVTTYMPSKTRAALPFEQIEPLLPQLLDDQVAEVRKLAKHLSPLSTIPRYLDEFTSWGLESLQKALDIVDRADPDTSDRDFWTLLEQMRELSVLPLILVVRADAEIRHLAALRLLATKNISKVALSTLERCYQQRPITPQSVIDYLTFHEYQLKHDWWRGTDAAGLMTEIEAAIAQLKEAEAPHT